MKKNFPEKVLRELGFYRTNEIPQTDNFGGDVGWRGKERNTKKMGEDVRS